MKHKMDGVGFFASAAAIGSVFSVQLTAYNVQINPQTKAAYSANKRRRLDFNRKIIYHSRIFGIDFQ